MWVDRRQPRSSGSGEEGGRERQLANVDVVMFDVQRIVGCAQPSLNTDREGWRQDHTIFGVV